MPWVLWITGLPGSGKSTVASAVKEKTPDSVMIRMDELRRIVTPQPTYSDSEREYVYRSLVCTGPLCILQKPSMKTVILS
jgi:adenylylsulfate kinase